MQQDAIDCANVALEKFNIEKDIAAYIKKEFDKKYNPTWHCVVGRNFGSYVTHETKHFIYFYMGQVAILLFKSGWTHISNEMIFNNISLLSPIFLILFQVKDPNSSKRVQNACMFFKEKPKIVESLSMFYFFSF